MNRRKEKFECSKTHANIGTIGHVGHGKTPLTSAIAQILSEKMGGERKETKDEKSKDN